MKAYYKNRGFTIVEVLIVLAIAAFIILIVFMAVPALFASRRDAERKTYVDLVASQLETYRVDNGGKYPETATEACTFITNYVPTPGLPIVTPCTNSFGGAGNCVTAATSTYTICYHDNNVPHDYANAPDEVSIALSHWCNTDPSKFGEDPSHPITNGNTWPFDSLYSRYVVWTVLERSTNVYCIDDYPREN